jgi:hypothetical protein
MTPAKEYEKRLITEYGKSKETLINKFSGPLSKQEAKESINATLLLASANQIKIIIKTLPSEYLAGVYITSDYLSRKVPAYVAVDLSHVSKANLNKITEQTIGQIGNFNKEIANELKLRYGVLISNNELLNSIEAHGYTVNVEKRMIKRGFDKETINLVKQQTTANKMVALLEQQGIRGGMHPDSVARLLRPHIRAVFGPEGVTIDNTGKLRKEFAVNADGTYGWRRVEITRPYHTTVRNYANTISRSSMLRAHRTGRLDTLHKSKLVQKWRYVSSMSANMCGQCGAMHGAILDDPYEYAGGLHARCACLGPQPIWKESTGLKNHTDDYYEKQKDEWFFKTYKTNEYNKTLPKDVRIPNYNFLPKSELGAMPGKEEMYKIRTAMLK